MEQGESICQAAVRETLEEAGIIPSQARGDEMRSLLGLT